MVSRGQHSINVLLERRLPLLGLSYHVGVPRKTTTQRIFSIVIIPRHNLWIEAIRQFENVIYDKNTIFSPFNLQQSQAIVVFVQAN